MAVDTKSKARERVLEEILQYARKKVRSCSSRTVDCTAWVFVELLEGLEDPTRARQFWDEYVDEV